METDEQTINFNIKTIPLNKIQVSHLLIPEICKIKTYLEPNKERINNYLSVLDSMTFHTGGGLASKPLIQRPVVWTKSESEIFLLNDLEYAEALKKIYSLTPSQPVECVALETKSFEGVKSLALKLRLLTGLGDSYYSRLYTIQLLIASGCGYQKIRKMFGIKKMRSSEGKQLERDYKLAKHPTMVNKVIGAPDELKSYHKELDEMLGTSKVQNKPQYPRPKLATLKYSQALNLLNILNDSEDCIERFSEEYDKYIDQLKLYRYPDEDSKNVYSWKRYNPEKVKMIAAKIARGEDKLIDQQELRDYSWRVKYNEDTLDYSIPETTLNLRDKEPCNIKKVFEVAYVTGVMHYTLQSYLKRICPAEHGALVRTYSSGIEPAPESKSNIPDLNNSQYIDSVRAYKWLKYSNFERLLKSLSLKAHDFGFVRSTSDCETTYTRAHDQFEKYYKDKFCKDIESYRSENPMKKPRLEIYSEIRIYLAKKAASKETVSFPNFITEMFSEVFNKVDTIQKNKEERVKIALRKEKQIYSHTWGEIKAALNNGRERNGNLTIKKGIISEERLLRAARELYLPDENRIFEKVNKLAKSIEPLIQDNNYQNSTDKKEKFDLKELVSKYREYLDD
jgi:hypothetical protein